MKLASTGLLILILSLPGAAQERRLSKMDSNHDGRISRDEFATAYQRWSERRNAPAGAPSGRAASPPSELDELE